MSTSPPSLFTSPASTSTSRRRSCILAGPVPRRCRAADTRARGAQPPAVWTAGHCRSPCRDPASRCWIERPIVGSCLLPLGSDLPQPDLEVEGGGKAANPEIWLPSVGLHRRARLELRHWGCLCQRRRGRSPVSGGGGGRAGGSGGRGHGREWREGEEHS